MLVDIFLDIKQEIFFLFKALLISDQRLLIRSHSHLKIRKSQ